MADSEAVRGRRKRAHARGDHSLCAPERCRSRGAREAELTESQVSSGGARPDSGSSRSPSETLAALLSLKPSLIGCPWCSVLIAAAESLAGHDEPYQPAVVSQLQRCVGQMALCEHQTQHPLDKLAAARQSGRLMALINGGDSDADAT